MFRMDSTTPSALRNKAAAGSGQRPARVDHKHSALGIEQVLFSKVAADMNVTTDQVLTKAWDFQNYLITEIRIANASASLTTAVGGFYLAAAKAGNAVVANSQAYSALDAATKGLSATLTVFAKDVITADDLYFALTTAQGGAATADIYVLGVPLTEGA